MHQLRIEQQFIKEEKQKITFKYVQIAKKKKKERTFIH